MAALTGSVLGLLDSAPVILGIVFGVPAALAVVVALGVRRRTPVVVLLAGSLMVVGVAVLAVWAVFQGPEVSRATAPGMSPPAGRPVDFTCAPAGAQVEETARGIAFGKTCLAAPADLEFTIRFDNQDSGTPHNIHIFAADPTSDPNARSLFEGELVTGPMTTTYRVSALPAGRYFFRCDVHPSQMFGGFVVG
ncbi:MAG: cupredoxin domain-containing protein [Actinomycetota bacterium]